MSSLIDKGRMDDAVRILLQDALGLAAPLNTHIHENDQMFSFIASTRGSESFAFSEYFTSGAAQLRILEQLVDWKFGSFEGVSSILDFASGYGRLTRFLVQELPPDRIWISEIQADAVAFQEAQFGVNGLVSTVDPEALVCGQTFDCIFVASLFSHLPPATFAAWLKKLFSLLNPGGLLAFSLNDAGRLTEGEMMPESGIWFRQASEVASIDAEHYGTTIVTEDFARNSIAEATGRTAYRRIQYGLQYHQDLYLVVNEPEPDFSTLHFSYLPHGAIDFGLWTRQGELLLRGWAADITGGGSPVVVQILVDGRVVQKCQPSIQRSDVQAHYNDDRFLHAGWECACRLPNDHLARQIVVKAVSAGGNESLLYAGSIAALIPRGGVDLCCWIRPEELYVAGWAADVTGEGQPVEVQLFVDGQLHQKCLPFIYRPDLREHYGDGKFLYAGWECSLHLANSDPARILVVKAVTGMGDESLLYGGSIVLLQGRSDLSGGRHEGLRHLQAEIAQKNADLAELQAVVERLHGLQADRVQQVEYIRHLESEIARKNAALAELEARLRLRPWQRRSPLT